MSYTMNVTAILEDTVGSYFSDSTTTPFNPQSVKADMVTKLDPLTFWTTYGNDLLTKMSKYFIPVCIDECKYNTTTQATRTYVWEGPSTSTMTTKWDQYKQAAQTDPTLMAPFTFKAYPQTICPYGASKCVPMEYAPVIGLLGKYCVPNIVQGVQSLVPESWGDTLSINFGDMVSDLATSWPVILIMSFGGLAISLIFLWILRYCVGVFIWISIALCFLSILAGAVTALLWSQKCAGETLFQQVKSIDTQSEALSYLKGSTACPNGFSIPDNDGRKSVQGISYFLFALSGIYLIVVFLVRKRIRLGIAINKVASQFVRQNVSATLVPLAQSLAIIAWWTLWLVVIVFAVTVVPANYRNMTATWVGDYPQAIKECSGADHTYIKSYQGHVPVYACKEVKYLLNWQFWFSIVAMFWFNSFILSAGQMVIAGAVGVWYFTPNHSKQSLGAYPIRTGFRNTFVYHIGTLAFGSLILGFIRFIRMAFWWVSSASNAEFKSKFGDNKFVKIIVGVIHAVLALIEKILKFLNKNAFIQTALMGTNFCRSCANAVSLIARNAVRIGTLGFMGGIVHFLGLLFITSATGLIGWGILAGWYDGQIKSPILPVFAMVIIGYSIGKIVISVFSISVDSILQCFCSDEELHHSEGGAKFTPQLLQTFLDSDDAKSCGVGGKGVVQVNSAAIGHTNVQVVTPKGSARK